jgi:hypothetical protein
MNYDDLTKKVDEVMGDLKLWLDFATKTKEKSEELTKFDEELKGREKILEKEKIISRERKELLDAREKNIEVSEARLQKYTKV